jgi:hypothetical protein
VPTVAPGQRGRVAAVFVALGAGPRSASRGVTGRWAGADHASAALLENPVRSASPARRWPPMASSTSCYAQSIATARSRKDCGLIGFIGRFAATSKGEVPFSGSLYRKFRELRGVGWGDRSRKNKGPDHRRPGPSCPLPNRSNRPSLRWRRRHPCPRPDGALARNERKTSCLFCQHLVARMEKRSYRGLRWSQRTALIRLGAGTRGSAKPSLPAAVSPFEGMAGSSCRCHPNR